jgi:hypothetical protein
LCHGWLSDSCAAAVAELASTFPTWPAVLIPVLCFQAVLQPIMKTLISTCQLHAMPFDAALAENTKLAV